MESWKQKLGDHATYNCLVNAFKCAGYQILADAVKNLLPHTDEVQRDDDNYFGESFASEPPPTPPPQQPVFPTIATKVLLHQQGEIIDFVNKIIVSYNYAWLRSYNFCMS